MGRVGPRRCVMSPYLLDVYMDGVVREGNVNVFVRWLELLRADGGRFELNQHLFADDIAQLADAEEE